MLCKLCNKNPAQVRYGEIPNFTTYHFCQKCSDENYASAWQCRECAKYFGIKDNRYFGGVCGKCVKKSLTCDTCYQQIKSPDRRNYYTGQCNKCLEDHNDDEVAFGNRESSVQYAKIGSRRSFGLELETSYSPHLSTIVKETKWGFYQDGSIAGKEFTSPPLSGNAGYKSIRDFCRLARRLNYRVNRSCGFHLHIDVRDFNEESLRRLCLAYHLTYPAWSQYVATSRRNNTYCRYDKSNFSVETLKMNAYAAKFNWISLSNIGHYGTIEVRLHQGTLNFRKIINWVRAHVKFVDWAKRHTVKEISDTFVQDWLVNDTSSIHKKLCKIWNKKQVKIFLTDRSRELCQRNTARGARTSVTS